MLIYTYIYIYDVGRIKGGWGWRLSLGLAGIPAALLTIGALLVVDTPNSLIERGHLEEGKAVLRRIRGTDNVEPEFLELVEVSRVARLVKHPFRELLKRRNRPQLVIAMALQVSIYLRISISKLHCLQIKLVGDKTGHVSYK